MGIVRFSGAQRPLIGVLVMGGRTVRWWICGVRCGCSGAELWCRRVCCLFSVAADNSGAPSSGKRWTVQSLRRLHAGIRPPAARLMLVARDTWAAPLVLVVVSLLPALEGSG
jgi:hypothetical protein